MAPTTTVNCLVYFVCVSRCQGIDAWPSTGETGVSKDPGEREVLNAHSPVACCNSCCSTYEV